MKKFLKDNWYMLFLTVWFCLNLKTLPHDGWFKLTAGILWFYWGLTALQLLIELPMKIYRNRLLLECKMLTDELNSRKQTTTKISVIFRKKH